MQNNAKTLAGALIAGLISGSLALADDTTAVPTPGSSAAPKAVKRKPHNGIKNKMACCKNGCDCMDEKTGKKKTEPKKSES